MQLHECSEKLLFLPDAVKLTGMCHSTNEEPKIYCRSNLKDSRPGNVIFVNGLQRNPK